MSRELQQPPKLPWKHRLGLSIGSFFLDILRRPNYTINRRIINFFDLKVAPSSTPLDGVISSDTAVDPSRDVWFRLYNPTVTASATSLPVIVYFHGGCFCLLSAASKPFDDSCRRFARELPAVIISVNYRLCPEHKYPSQYEDGFDALKFIDKADPDQFPTNADFRRCFLAGDSAGANLAHHVALRASEYEFRRVNIVGLISIQPFFGGEERTESEMELSGDPILSRGKTDWYWKALLGEGTDRDHPAVNPFGPKSGDISGLKYPSTLVFVGGFDPLKDWQRRYYDGLKRSGKEARLIEYPNAPHSFYTIPELPESSLLVKDVKEFVDTKKCVEADE